MSSRVLLLIAGCTLSLASFATTHVPCKSGQKAAQKGSAVCAPAPAVKSGTKAKAPVKGKAVNKAHAKVSTKSKAAIKSKGKAATASKGKAKALAITAVPLAAAVLPPNSAIVDCDSTQTFMQGSVASCAAPIVPDGSGLPTQLRVNPGTSCFAALAASHSSRRLASQVPFLSASAATPEVLANRAVPNRNEKQELGSVIAGYGMCLDMAATWRKQTYAPAVVSTLDAYWHEAQAILKELAGGKRSFGDAARAIADTDKAYKNRIATLERVANLPSTNAAQ